MSPSLSPLRRWIPTAVEDGLRPLLGRGNYFKGQFRIWDDALVHSTGYDAELILEKVKAAQSKVKSGEAAFERDSVPFDRIQYSFPVLAALQYSALRDAGRLSVLDFGGALGSSYHQCLPFLDQLPGLRWSVVEQPNFVRCGMAHFSDERLSFFHEIGECMAARAPNVALLSSVLQYVEKPYAVLDELMRNGMPLIVLDRTPFSDRPDDFITVQHVPKKIYSASYPCWIFSRARFRGMVESRYEIMAEFEGADGAARACGTGFSFGGMILRKRD